MPSVAALRCMQGACVIVLIAHVLLLVSYVDPLVSCVMYGFACQCPSAPSRPSLADQVAVGVAPAAIWPMVPLEVESRLLATAYGIIVSFLNGGA